MNKRTSGFTIVEMSVVVLIIGLLIVGVLSGKNLIDGGKTRSVLSEFDEYRQSMLQFQEKYFDWPGDVSNATTYWPGTVNGNGNEQIAWATEGAMMWRHLELAAMIGQTGFSTAVNANAVVGSTVPSSKLVGAGWFVNYTQALKNHLGIGAQKASGMNDGPVVEPKRAFEIDSKLDDGYPSTGQVQSTGTNCFSGTAYTATDPSPNCVVTFTLKSR
jgi:prepilin-type N-terminal cleavage/methylation domain-containing protein